MKQHTNIDFPTIRNILVNEFDIEEGTPDLAMMTIWNNVFKQIALSKGIIDRYINPNGEKAPRSMGGFMIADTTTEFGRWLSERVGMA